MNTPAVIDGNLLQRYDRPGPRYTSYPTVPQFRSDFSAEDLYARRPAPGNAQPLSLYVHIPFCHSPCFYCGCNRIITRDPTVGERYVQRVLSEATLVKLRIDRRGPVLQLHLGGGTPNFLSGRSLENLMQGLAGQFDFSEQTDRDFSVELDPRSLPEDPDTYAVRLARLGFNRISLGVQDFDPAVQAAVNRPQSSEQTLELIDACRDHGVRSVNIDLIYGLPKQSPESFRRTLRMVMAARPDRIAVYGYAHMPAMFKAQRRISAADLPDAPGRLALLRVAIEELTACGYRHIGMDHFALPDDDLTLAQERRQLQRNFMGYTTHAGYDLVGLGVSAISRLGNCYGQNLRDLPSWERAIDAHGTALWRGLRLSADDRVRANVIEQLMCHGHIDIAEIEAKHGIDFSAHFVDALSALAPMLADGLITRSAQSITVTDVGRVLLRNIAMCFDRYLPSGIEAPLASRTV